MEWQWHISQKKAKCDLLAFRLHLLLHFMVLMEKVSCLDQTQAESWFLKQDPGHTLYLLWCYKSSLDVFLKYSPHYSFKAVSLIKPGDHWLASLAGQCTQRLLLAFVSIPGFVWGFSDLTHVLICAEQHFTHWVTHLGPGEIEQSGRPKRAKSYLKTRIIKL